jgi:hypothetical protein
MTSWAIGFDRQEEGVHSVVISVRARLQVKKSQRVTSAAVLILLYVGIVGR